jgi:hypothetical protein
MRWSFYFNPSFVRYYYPQDCASFASTMMLHCVCFNPSFDRNYPLDPWSLGLNAWNAASFNPSFVGYRLSNSTYNQQQQIGNVFQSFFCWILLLRPFEFLKELSCSPHVSFNPSFIGYRPSDHLEFSKEACAVFCFNPSFIGYICSYNTNSPPTRFSILLLLDTFLQTRIPEWYSNLVWFVSILLLLEVSA